MQIWVRSIPAAIFVRSDLQQYNCSFRRKCCLSTTIFWLEATFNNSSQPIHLELECYWIRKLQSLGRLEFRTLPIATASRSHSPGTVSPCRVHHCGHSQLQIKNIFSICDLRITILSAVLRLSTHGFGISITSERHRQHRNVPWADGSGRVASKVLRADR